MSSRIGIAVLVALCLNCAAAQAVEYAPLDRPGPALSPSTADLARSLNCTDGVSNAQRDPVLLLAGTTINTADNFGWNFEPALRAEQIPYCTLDEPGTLDQNLGDLQLRGEYIVYAVRKMHRLSGRKVAIYGHSQGGTIARWALRFWPDTRNLVSDLVGAAPSNHGTMIAPVICVPGCAPGIAQQTDSAEYQRAVNSGKETFAGISYTQIATSMDEIVVPYTLTQLHTGDGQISNVTIQDICPGHIADHLLVGTSDPITWALFKDAIDHAGPADPKRINRSVCSQAFMPGVNPATFATDFAATSAHLATALLSYPHASEPALACYVLAVATCPPDPAYTTPAKHCRTSATIHVPAGYQVRSARIGNRALKHHGNNITVPLAGKPVTVTIRAKTRSGRLVTLTRRVKPCR